MEDQEKVEDDECLGCPLTSKTERKLRKSTKFFRKLNV
jgi:hypothetical protein